jgi:dipeptidyl aminopeptidase/acylaminoacyl peptidase
VSHVAWENPDGDRVAGWLYAPADGDAPHPTVTCIHGGPTAYDDPRFDSRILHWTTESYAVFTPNYRGSTSYGRAFSECIRGDWGPREVADVCSGVDELVARGVADPDRLFVTGFSQGGVITGYVVAETDRFAAAAAEHGVYDNRAAFGVDDCHAWWEHDFGLPWEHPDAYDRTSSILDVGEMDTPTLLLAGGEDHRCPPQQSEQLYVSLKKRDVPAKLVVSPDEHHAITDPDRAIHRLRTITEWFERFDSREE